MGVGCVGCVGEVEGGGGGCWHVRAVVCTCLPQGNSRTLGRAAVVGVFTVCMCA